MQALELLHWVDCVEPYLLSDRTGILERHAVYKDCCIAMSSIDSMEKYWLDGLVWEPFGDSSQSTTRPKW